MGQHKAHAAVRSAGLARPRGDLNLSPKAKAGFYVGIPAAIVVCGECLGAMVCLTEIPSEQQSKNWHGSPLVGNLGYAPQTHARRIPDPAAWPGHGIGCTISVVNVSDHQMPIERFYIETRHLAVFEKDGDLIEVGGLTGVLDSIGIISASVSTPDNRSVRIPNEVIGNVMRAGNAAAPISIRMVCDDP